MGLRATKACGLEKMPEIGKKDDLRKRNLKFKLMHFQTVGSSMSRTLYGPTLLWCLCTLITGKILGIAFQINRTNQTNEVTKDPAAFIVYNSVIRRVNLGESHQQRDWWDSD